MKVAKNWNQFQDWVDRLYPKINQTLSLPFPEPDDDEEEEAQLITQRIEPRIFIGSAVHIDLGIERRTDRAGITQFLELANHVGTKLDE